MATETITPKTLAGLPVRAVQERSKFLNILIYGNSGVGKTVLAGSADEVPSMRPVLFVDIEGGTESLRNLHPNVEVVRVQTWDQMQEVYDALHQGNHEYRTVVLDSLTEIQKFNMYNVMKELTERKDDVDPDIPGMREWGKNIEQMRRFVRGFRDLEMHTVFTALMRTDKNQRTGKETMKPAMSGKLADEVAAFLDIVAYYYIKEVHDEALDAKVAKRLLLTQTTEQQVAKDRSNLLPQVIDGPSMKSLMEMIYPTQQQYLDPGIDVESDSETETEPMEV